MFGAHLLAVVMLMFAKALASVEIAVLIARQREALKLAASPTTCRRGRDGGRGR